MRKIAIIAACLTLVLGVTASIQWSKPNDAEAAQDSVQMKQRSIHILIEGKPLTLATPAFIENGSTLVPVREIAEALGAEVQYDRRENGSPYSRKAGSSSHAWVQADAGRRQAYPARRGAPHSE